jgi:hypothetical protein
MTAQADAKLAEYEEQLASARNRKNEDGRKVRAEASAREKAMTDKACAETLTLQDASSGRVDRLG